MSTKPSIPSLSKLSIGAPVPPSTSQGRAFVFVIADAYPEKNIDEPLVLVLKHKNDYNAYGLPGGLQDPSDYGKLLTTALRELAEEWLNIPKTVWDNNANKMVDNQKKQKNDVMSLMFMSPSYDGIRGRTLELHPKDAPMGIYVMRVPSALHFEKMSARFNSNIDPALRRQEKQKVDISKEINGYAWITKSAIKEAVDEKITDNFGRLMVKTTHDPNKRLPIRNYVFGKMKKNGTWEPNRFTQEFIS